MAVNIGPRIGIDGEKEYRAQINQIIQQAKTLDSEMRAVTSAFDDSTSAQDKNAATSKVLAKQIDVQRQRVRALSDMLQKSADKYGENDIKTLKWEQSVNDATASLNRMEKGLGETTGEGSGFGDVLETLAGKLGINLPDGIGKTLNGMGSLSTKMTAIIGVSAAVVTAIVAIEKALVEMTLAQAEAARETETMAQVMGMTTTEYQEWDYILKSVGYSAEQAQGDLSMLAERAMDAAEGVGEGAELFNKLGINVEKSRGILKSQSELFTEVVDKLSKMTDETERNAIASALLNTTGERLVPILNATSGEMETMRQRAHELGVVLAEEDVTALSDLSKTAGEFQAAGEGLQKMIAGKMSPSLENLLDKGTDVVVGLTDALENSGIIEVFSGLLDIVAAISPLFDLMFASVEQNAPALQGLAVALAIVADALGVVANLIAIVVEGVRQLGKLLTGEATTKNLEKYANNLNRIFSSQGATAQAISRIGSNAGGTPFWRGGLTWVGEYGPELVNLPRGSQVYSHEQSVQMMGGDTYNVSISAGNIKEFADIVRIAQNERVNRRAGYAGR